MSVAIVVGNERMERKYKEKNFKETRIIILRKGKIKEEI